MMNTCLHIRLHIHLPTILIKHFHILWANKDVDGMKIDRRLTFIGIMLVILSMTMATQYATTKVGYSYTVVHPSDADIRFIASDNATDGIMILRVSGNNDSGARALTLKLGGNWTENFNKTYTCAFGIVNEENFSVTISHVNVSTSSGSDYLQIWLHSDRDVKAGSDTSGSSIMVWNKGSVGFGASDSVWVLADGDQNAATMNNHGGNDITTGWNETAHVRYSLSDIDAINGTDDYVWVQISMDIPASATEGSYTGLIWVHFRANTVQ